MKTRMLALLLAAVVTSTLEAQVGSDRLVSAAKEARNWLIYSGGYSSQRHSSLAQITPANAKNLELKWMYQAAVAGAWQTTPLVVDGVIYLTQRPNDVVALDATSGRVFWIYVTRWIDQIVCCGANSRGLAILGGTLLAGTLDAHLGDRCENRTRRVESEGEKQGGYSVTRPAVVKDKVVSASAAASAESAASSPPTTAEERPRRRFYTIPRPEQSRAAPWKPVRRTKTRSAIRGVKRGGGSVWVTGSRSRAQHDLLGRRQCRPRLEQRAAARRQPLHRLGRRTRRRYRPAGGTLPVPPHASSYDSVRCPLADAVARGRSAMVWANHNSSYMCWIARREVLSGKPFVKGELDGRSTSAAALQTRSRGEPAWRATRAGPTGTPSSRPHRDVLRVGVEGLRPRFGGTRSSIRKDATSAAASIVRSCRSPARRRLRVSAAARSTTGPKQRPPARCWRSTRPPAI